ncbi:hypothetical protein [Streptomyces beigongshangae]|uniref:hypothetical protein n=1 Tax=Streptomyces beigongshangae TaxID=2841597 RepID=UPI001C85882E|nr:hypothetical protein [Streptomyces sp. REN17]
MLAYELQKIRSAEMIRDADDYRRAREAVRGRRTAGHASARSGRDDGEGRVNGRRHRRLRFARTA